MTSQNTSSLISQIYKSRSVILELMKAQNYNISEYDGFSVNEINTMKTNNQLDLILSKNPYEEEEDNGHDDSISIFLFRLFVSPLFYYQSTFYSVL